MVRSVARIASYASCEDLISLPIDAIADIRDLLVVTCTVSQRIVWIDNLILRYPTTLGDRLHLCAHSRGLAVCHCGDGFVFSPRDRVELILSSDQ